LLMTLDISVDNNNQETTQSDAPGLSDQSTDNSAAALALLSAALLAACGGGGGGGEADSSGNSSGNDGSLPSAPGFNNFPKAANDNEAARFLLHSQLDASDAEIATVKNSTSYAAYLTQQFAKPIRQTGWQWLEQRGYGDANSFNFVLTFYPADFMLWKQLFTEPDGMRKRIALALSEFFVASLQSAAFNWPSHAYAQYWDLLNANAFGNFRKLLEDVTLSPAMGDYLNTKGNQKEDGKGRLPDENYAREVMQLFTIGLYKLNLDGTEQIGPDGKKLESYTQDDVSNLARVFTGYDFDRSGDVRIPVYRQDGTTSLVESKAFTQKPMLFDEKKHSLLEAKFLGVTVAARTATTAAGPASLKIALDTLFNHPNVGPFFAKQMIQRLVTSNPSPAYVARVASAFNNNGAGVRGDLKAVWAAILLDDEARNPANVVSRTFGKLREPMLRFIQWGRSFGLASEGDAWKVGETSDAAKALGQSPLRSPSVFNFFRPGFVPPGTELAKTKTLAPEFQLVNETAVGGCLNRSAAGG
jgi:uncharacterized protein (DUF1800 family)